MYFSTSGSTGITDLIAFYRKFNPRPDSKGRLLDDILNWSDRRLEDGHDYIQVLFPLPESSRFNYNAPIVDEEVFNAFNANGGRVDLHENLQRAFIRILWFYGFEVPEAADIRALGGQDETHVEAVWAADHEKRFANWVRGGHNNLRITRVIRSLRVLGRQDLAGLFLRALESVWNSSDYKCNEDSMEWWLKAYYWPLYSPPSGNEGEVGEGLDWLKQIVDSKSTGTASEALA